MRKLPYLLIVLAVPTTLVAACSSDKSINDGQGSGATGTTGATNATGGKSSTTAGKGSVRSNAGDGTGDTGNTGNESGAGATDMGGAAPGGPGDCDLSGAGKERVDIANPIDFDFELTPDKVWVIKGLTYVTGNATLTVDACTRVEGDLSDVSALIVTRGSKLVADGTENSPVLFTSQKAIGKRAAGDWGGVALLGKAPINSGAGVRPEAYLEGVVQADKNLFGGTEAEDSSGSLEYVRIEYAGYALSENNELNGLTLAGIGSKTKLSHIEVNAGLDDCFEWFGGTVNADHLICNTDGDDSFDTDAGFTGTNTYLFSRKRANPSGDPNGFEWDNNRNVETTKPITNPTFKNVTMCGFGFELGEAISYGMVLRRGTAGTMDNIVLTGFDFGVDVRDVPQPPGLTLTNSIFFGQLQADVVDPNDCNDVNAPIPPGGTVVPSCNHIAGAGDGGFNELAWFKGENPKGPEDEGTNPYEANTGNSTDSPGFTIDDCQADGGPNMKVTGSKVGAFVDGNWLTGAWIDWADK